MAGLNEWKNLLLWFLLVIMRITFATLKNYLWLCFEFFFFITSACFFSLWCKLPFGYGWRWHNELISAFKYVLPFLIVMLWVCIMFCVYARLKVLYTVLVIVWSWKVFDNAYLTYKIMSIYSFVFFLRTGKINRL